MRFLSFAVILIASLVGPDAWAGFRTIESAIESSASLTTLPARDGEPLEIRSCATCNAQRLRTSPSTAYLIGDDRVSLVDLARYLKSQPLAFVTVRLDRRANLVTAVMAERLEGSNKQRPGAR